ncbi:MAG: hypothetical protein ACOYL6_11035 [Bacteriovoracaceae bacterium]
MKKNIILLIILFVLALSQAVGAGPWKSGTDLDMGNLQRSEDYKELEKKLEKRSMYFSLSVLHEDNSEVQKLDSLKPYYLKPIPKDDKELLKCSESQSYLKEVCIIELARSLFAQKKFEEADALYESIPNRSLHWPSILLERAWTNYKTKNYNRSLGLLSTYKFPFLEPFKSSEVNYLEALSFFRLCLWGDALFSLEQFKKFDLPRFQALESFLKNLAKDQKLMVSGSVKAQDAWPTLLKEWVSALTRENYWVRRQIEIGQISLEVKALESSPESLYRDLIMKKLVRMKEAKQVELGAFFNQRLKEKVNDYLFMMDKIEALELEVLSASRKVFYAKKDKAMDRNVGDPEYLPKKKFQYYWDFHDEFWSDELGFYVFALKSQC